MQILQTTLFPTPGLPEALYLRVNNPRRARAVSPGSAEDGKTCIRLAAGDILSTDTFFGSFYRAYWQAYTAVRDIAVVVGFRGQGKVRVFEDTGKGVVQLCEYDLRSSALQRHLIRFSPVSLDAALFGGEPVSRLFVEIEAKRACEVHGIEFVTDSAPQRAASLSIGLCTFNQETYFARTLTRIAGLAAATDAIRAVHVVNQGAEFQSGVIRTLLTAPKIHGITQRNLGGCGGFTRSLAEELAVQAPASHHLMMDDDIVLDERMILRALRFLDYADRDIALGAGMIDSLRPTVMYEAGAFLRNDNTIHPYCHNVDLADPAQLWYFNAPVKTDYNAWWFCILPVAQARALALPAPVFIRGDDFEYGQRLARAGVPTVTLPGIGIWHEPFYAKPSGWQDYYDLRNRLIFGATYGDKVRQLSLAHVLGLITTAILTHNYASAALRMQAVADFLQGPERLFARDPEAIHQGIMALARRDAPEKLDSTWKQRPLTPGKPRPATMRGLAWAQLGALLRTGLGPLRHRDTVLIDADAHPGNTAGTSYVLTNGPRSFHLRFTPHRGRMWGMMARAARLAWRYRQGRAAAGAAWMQGIAAYRTPDWWAATFGAAALGQAPAPDLSSPAAKLRSLS